LSSSLSSKFEQGQLGAGTQSTQKSSGTQSGILASKMIEVPLSAGAVLSPPKSEYAIFLQSQSPKIRDCKEIVETRKQRLLETKTKNFTGPPDIQSSASALFTRSTSPNREKVPTKAANVAGTEGCNIKMGDARVFAGSNLYAACTFAARHN
jgi:hypothetical protein